MFLVKHPDGVGALAALLRELQLSPGFLSPLLAHAAAVRREGDRLGLVSKVDLDHVLPRHTADSLLFALARAPAAGEGWADVGTGAGFPGLVLAICYPATRFALIEPQQRRAGFLELMAADLGLSNCEVVAARASAAPQRAFDVVTARALAEPSVALDAISALLREGGEAMLAVSEDVPTPSGARVLRMARPGVDSPGRLLMMTRRAEGA